MTNKSIYTFGIDESVKKALKVISFSVDISIKHYKATENSVLKFIKDFKNNDLYGFTFILINGDSKMYIELFELIRSNNTFEQIPIIFFSEIFIFDLHVLSNTQGKVQYFIKQDLLDYKLEFYLSIYEEANLNMVTSVLQQFKINNSPFISGICDFLICN